MEAEFELLTVEEAEKRPVGKRHKEPEPSEKPKGAGGAVQEAGPEPGGGGRGQPGGFLIIPTPPASPQLPRNLLQLVCEPAEDLRRLWRRCWHILLLLAALITVFLLVSYTRPGLISQVTVHPLHRP